MAIPISITTDYSAYKAARKITAGKRERFLKRSRFPEGISFMQHIFSKITAAFGSSNLIPAEVTGADSGPTTGKAVKNLCF